MSWLVAVGVGHVHEIGEREHIELALAAALHAHGAAQINNPMFNPDGLVDDPTLDVDANEEES